MKNIIAFVLLISFIACKNKCQNISDENNPNQAKKSWDFLKTDGTMLIFKDKTRLNTRLYEMNYLETLSDSSNNPYFVLSGNTCKDCDENIGIFLLCPDDTLKPLSKLFKYSYPGKEYDYENNKLIFESKLYIGNCISNNNNICLIWVQKESNENNKINSSVFIVDMYNNNIRERSVLPNSNEYDKILLEIKTCKEIQGIETTSEP